MNRITCSRCLGKKHVDQADIKRLNRENEWIPGPCAYCEEKGVVNSDKMDKALVDDADIVYNIDSKELYLGSNPKANKIENKKTEKIDVNEEIEGSLKECIKESIKDFINTQNPHPLFVKIFSELKKIDAEKVKQEFIDELKKNCKEHWTNTNEGFNPNEKVQVLLFEYDHFKTVNPEALSYGLIGDDFKIKTYPYYYGWNYDFVSSIESSNGITLTTLSPLTKISDDIPAEYENTDFLEEKGYTALIDSYLFTTYLILHDAIKEFTKSDEFKLLSRENVLHFVIGEHDYSGVQPLYYYYENEASFKKAVEEQGEPIDSD